MNQAMIEKINESIQLIKEYLSNFTYKITYEVEYDGTLMVDIVIFGIDIDITIDLLLDGIQFESSEEIYDELSEVSFWIHVARCMAERVARSE